MKNNLYIAIIGDIHSSRSLKDREQAQNKLLKTLEKINKKYKKSITSKFTIAMGDSFQGLLTKQAPFIQIIMDIEFSMYPVEFRFGIGLGEITTDIQPEDSQLNDGPAYHRARQIIETIEENKRKHATGKTNLMILTENEPTPTDHLMNAIFTLNYAVTSKWSTRQWEVIKTYLENEENQYHTAHALDIGQSSVSKALKSANFYSYKSSLTEIQKFMQMQNKEVENV